MGQEVHTEDGSSRSFDSFRRRTDGRASTIPNSLATLQTDTLSILTPTTPVPLRMETIRRAALYAAEDPVVAERLAIQLLTRVLDSQAAHPSAWFDAGYLIASLRQARHQRTTFSGVHPKQWVRHAIALGWKGMEDALVRIPE